MNKVQQSRKMSIKFHLFLYGLFIFTPFVDALTGFLIHSHILAEGGLASPSQLLRFTLLALSMLFLNKKQFLFLALIYLLFIFIEVTSLFRHQNLFVLVWGQLFILKILTIYVFFCVLNNYWSNYKSYIILLYFKSALLYGFILLITTLLGINVSTYEIEGTFGSKGIFASGNGLGFYLGSTLCLFGYLNREYLNLNRRQSIFYQTVLFFCTLLVGTKASFIFLVLFLLYKFIFATAGRKIIMLTLVGSFLFISLPKIIDSLSIVYDVIIYRYNQNDFWSFIFSSRDEYVSNAFKIFFQEDYCMRFFTGGGSILSFQDPTNFTYDTLETDLFDIFFMYGIIFTIAYLGIIIAFLRNSLLKKRYVLFFTFLAVSTHSMMIGHVVFNAMSSIVVVLLMLLIINNNCDENYMLSST